MMTDKEKQLAKIIRKVNLDETSYIGIMLFLRGKVHEQDLMLNYLNSIDLSKVTDGEVVHKLGEILGI